jgi:membrane protein required for colicin V production
VVLNWADWVILSIFVVSLLFGLIRGLVKEALSLATWAIALVVAVSFRDELASLFVHHIQTPSLRQVVAFGLLFLITFVVCALVSYLIGALIKMTGLSFMDRLLGMAFGLLRGFVIVMAILILVPPFIAIDRDKWWSESALIHRFLEFEDWARVLWSSFSDLLARLFS